MAHIKFSVVVTILNEEKTIEVLLSSLINQSLLADEIILVDAGSTDDTIQLIQDIVKKTLIPIKLIRRVGANRSVGRNIGIKAANNNNIAVIDAGCEADSRWLEELSYGFTKNVQSVAGFYAAVIKKSIQRIFSVYVSTTPDNLNEITYLPSSRSLAFTKDIWEKVGKYPEDLDTCEDLVFASKLKKDGNMAVCPKAIVLWNQADNFSGFYKQIQGYARGDVEAGYVPHLWKILSVWLRYALFFLLPPWFLVYIIYPLVKHRREIYSANDVFFLPAVQLTADAAVLTGSLWGLIRVIKGVFKI